MAHDRKRSVTTAASLFGDSSSSSDFFASAIPEEPPQEPIANGTTDAFSQHQNHSTNDATNLFSEYDQGDSLWDQTAGTGNGEEWLTQTEPVGHGEPPQDTGVNYESYDGYAGQEEYANTAVDDPYVNQGWYDEHGQWHEYPYHSQEQQNWTNETAYPATQDTGYATTSYDYDYAQGSYAPVTQPTTTSSTTYPANAYSNGSVYATQETYDPYQPVGTSQAYSTTQTLAPPTGPSGAAYSRTASGSYFSGASYASQSPYDPYGPSTTAAAPPTLKSSSTMPSLNTLAGPYTFDTPQPNVAAVSAQEAANKYRSTSYNAYDPPILDRSKRGSKGNVAPPPLAQLHGTVPAPLGPAYAQTTSPPPVAPPPPRNSQYRGSSMTSPTIQAVPPPLPAVHAVPPPPPSHTYAGSNSAYDPYTPNPQSVSRPPQNNVYGQYPPVEHQAPQYPAQPDYSQQTWDQTHDHHSYPVEVSNKAQNGYGEHRDHAGYQYLGDENTAAYAQQGEEYDPEGGETSLNDAFGDVEGTGAWSQESPEVPHHSSYHALPPKPQSPPLAPYAPSKRDSTGSKASYNGHTVPPTGPPRASAVQTSSPSSVNAMGSINGSLPSSPRVHSPGNRFSPPTSNRSAPRTRTPASVRSTMVSPENSKYTLNGTTSSPQTLPYQSSGQSRMSSPSVSVADTNRSRVTSPVAGVKAAPPPPSTSRPSSMYDPYQPSSSAYAPPATTLGTAGPPPRTASPYAPPTEEGSVAATAYNPYSPTSRTGVRRLASTSSEYGSYEHPSQYGVTPPDTTYPSRTSLDSAYVPPATQTGGNDPLGRTGARIPVIAFGFGGKVVSCFHSQMDSTAGFDVSLLSRKSSPVVIRTLQAVLGEAEAPAFPGPLFADPGPPTVNIARTAASGVKTKKAAVLKYLDGRIDEVEKSLPHVTDADRSRTSGKLALVKLLKIMVENDGKVSGSADMTNAVRSALVPRLDLSTDTSTSYGFSAPGAERLLLPGDTSMMHAASQLDTSLMTYHVKSSTLDKLQDYLLRGDRQLAYRHALDERLWAHAMLISSSLDKDAWREVVTEFIRTELGVDAARAAFDPSNGRESLRVAYSLFSGQGAAAVDELVPPRPLVGAPVAMPTVPPSLVGPLRPSVSGGQSSLEPIHQQVLSKWTETAATIISNTTTGDSAAMTALGDRLVANGWPEAAHACYILSLQTSLLGGAGAPSAKVVLVGSESPDVKPGFHTDEDCLIFSEILEFALSLVPSVKGQDAFSGIPHLQAYRLVHAMQLAEVGHINLATRYCEAIGAALKGSKQSLFYTPTFQEQLRDFLDRLAGTPQLDKSGSWIARKMTKPSLATLGSWIESGVTKFIAGEGEDAAQVAAKLDAVRKDAVTTPSGPFAQYTVISSTNNSPNASSVNLASGPNVTSLVPSPPIQALPRRSGSALAFRTSHLSMLSPTDRAVSAMDVRPQALSANAAITSFSQMSDYPAQLSQPVYPSLNVSTPSGGNWWDTSDAQPKSTDADDDSNGMTPTATINTSSEDTANFVSPMDSLNPSPSPGSMNPTPRSMSAVPAVEEEEDDDLGFGNKSSKRKQREKKSSGQAEEEEEAKQPESPKESTAASSAEKSASRPDIARTSSWLPWKWGGKKEDAAAMSGGGPVKAKLGEESSFYYDKEQKRWVNKKVGDSGAAAPAALPPPPSRTPSRAQTASPGTATAQRGATPPPRPFSSAGAVPSPAAGAAPPARSRLAESFVPSQEHERNDGDDGDVAPPSLMPPPGRPSTAAGSFGGSGLSHLPASGSSPAPPARPASRVINDPDLVVPQRSTSAMGSAAKRKGKSRYVDVFATPPSG